MYGNQILPPKLSVPPGSKKGKMKQTLMAKGVPQTLEVEKQENKRKMQIHRSLTNECIY